MHLKFSVCGLVLLASLPAFSGVLIERELSGGIKEQHLYQAGQYANLENGELQGIINQKENLCLSIVAAKKIYFEGSCSELTQAIRNQYSKMGKDILQRYASLSMQQREGMLKSRAGIIKEKQKTKVSQRALGTGEYLGYPIKKIMMTIDDNDYAEYWLSDALQKTIENEFDIKAYDAWQNDMGSQMEQMELKIFGGKVPDPIKDTEQQLYKLGQVMKLLPAPKLQMDGSRQYQSSTITKIEVKTLNWANYRPAKDMKALSSWSEFLQASDN